MAKQPQVVLSRIWLVKPGEICVRCHMRRECHDRSRYLHLVASAGGPIDGAGSWNPLDGALQRFPMGVRKVGRNAATGQPVEVEEMVEHTAWIVHPDWAQREGIRVLGASHSSIEARCLASWHCSLAH